MVTTIFVVGVDRHAHKVLLLCCERLAHGLGAPGDGVLVIERLGVAGDGAQAVEQLRRGIEVGEACERLTARTYWRCVSCGG